MIDELLTPVADAASAAARTPESPMSPPEPPPVPGVPLIGSRSARALPPRLWSRSWAWR
ncbi:MAG: hypothetical protein HZY75_14340 [Nocardioidaceae bacterium]|nr:MAG: hypothetical protein HZY75_14340 [Nocardioidaceae bacterium]